MFILTKQNNFRTKEYKDYIKSSDSKKELLNMANSEYNSLKESYVEKHLASKPKKSKTIEQDEYKDMGRQM